MRKSYNENMKIIAREPYLAKIRPFYDSRYIKALTGVRRCGKSELLYQIIRELKSRGIKEDHIIFLDLEAKSGEDITTRKALEKRIDSLVKDEEKYYIFIDEVQHIRKFEEAIASVRASYNCSLFVTGSNSKLLHGKLQDRLTGRAKEFEILPFTYSEVLQFKEANGIPLQEDELEDYLRFGGMPQRFDEVDEDGIRTYFSDLFASIVEKDVYGNHKKLNKFEFENVAHYILSTTGKPFSALSIAKYLKEQKAKEEQRGFANTVNDYAKYLEESYLIRECRPYYLKGKESLNGAKKYYCVDVGLRNTFGNFVELDDTFSLEEAVYQELLYRGYHVQYGKMPNGEIDFVASKNRKKCLIQVAYSIDTEKVYEREYGAFDKIKDNSPKYVLSLDKKDTSHNGITHLNALDFLKGEADLILT